MKESIPGVEGGERFMCDGCSNAEGMPDPKSPTGTELVVFVEFTFPGGSIALGNWHQTCLQFSLAGGHAYQGHLIQQERLKRSLSLDMPDAVGPGGLLKQTIEAETENLMRQREQAIAASNIGPLLKFALRVRDVGSAGDVPTRLTVLENYERDLKAEAARAIVATAIRFGMSALAFDVLKDCQAHKDGECTAVMCPQTRDSEPMKSGRHCPLD